MTEKTVDVRFGAQTGALDAALKELVGSIGSATSRINADLAELASRTKTTENRIESSTSGIGGAFRRMASGIGGTLSSVGGVLNSLYRNIFSVHTAIVGLIGGGLVATVKGALESAAAIKDVGNAANASTTYIQEMRYASGQLGGSAQVMDDALVKLNKNLGEFRTSGAGPAAQALQFLGLASRVTADDFANTDEAMDAVLRKLAEVPNAADRAALASDLFGKAAGPKMAEMLKTGEEGIRAAREEAHKLGLVMTEDMINKADDADDKLNALWETIKTTGTVAIAANSEAIKQLAQDFAEAMPGILQYMERYARYWGILSSTPMDQVGDQIYDLEGKLANFKKTRDEIANGERWDALMLPDVDTMDAHIAELESQIGMMREIAKVQGALADSIEYAKPDPNWNNGELTVTGKRRPRVQGVDPKGAGVGTSEDPAVGLARSAAQQEIDIERDKELTKLDIYRQALDTRHGLGQMGDWLYLSQVRFIADQEYAVQRESIQRQLAVENLKPQQRLQLQGELELLELEHQARMADISNEAERLKDEARQREIQAERQKNDQIARDRDKMANDVESFTNRLLSGQLNAQTLLQALAQQAQQMVVKFIGQRVAAAIYGEQVETAAAIAGAATRTGVAGAAASAAVTLQKGKAQKSIMTSAAETFANVYAYLSPYMGPFAAVPAGLAYAAVLGAGLLLPSAAGGTEVTKDGIHMLHEKEVVLPAKWSQRLASLADAASGSARAPVYPSLPGGGEGQDSGSGLLGGRSLTFHVNAIDAGGVRDFFRRYGVEVGEGMHRAVADGHFRAA
jgi:phage-related protein